MKRNVLIESNLNTTFFINILKRMELIGKYGLKTKKEVWRLQLTLARIRKAARELLTLEDKDPRRIFEGEALMRRMYTYGFLEPTETKLDYVLGLTV